jgi:eukaryotic-like serine/threonine-protein kinase
VELTSPGRVLGGRYRLVQPIARGGMATVWLADDPVLSRKVAVKILKADLAADEATRARFRHEAISAARLSHPCIVSTYDTGDDDGTAYIVMELVEGPTLRQLVQDTGGLPVRDVVKLGTQVADALDAAHRAGLVHRDVKPANVLVPPRGPVKVTDFGIAKAAGIDDLTKTGTVMGTARYLAPEQVSGKPTDARTDVYALGLLLFECLTGHPPFGGDTDVATAMARLTTSAPSIRAERPDVPPALDDVIHRCLARNPEQRFDSAADVREALRRAELDPTGSVARPNTAAHAVVAGPPSQTQARYVGADDTNTAPVPAPAAAPTRRRRRRAWPWVLLLLVLLGAAAAAIVVLASDDSTGNGASGVPTPSDVEPTITATAFDPYGIPPGDEDNEHANNVVTGAPPPWSTEHYLNFSEKPGVGLALDLGRELDVSTVTVDAIQAGWSARVYASTKDASQLTTLDDWGQPVRDAGGVGPSHTFTFDSTKARSVLVWFTKLPTGDDATQYLQVAEVTVG